MLAGFALVMGAIVVVIVIAGSVGGSSGGPNRAAGRTHHAPHRSGAHYYVVQPGENLSVIAAKTHIHLARLIELNPNLDPQLIPDRACVNLVPSGCKELSQGG